VSGLGGSLGYANGPEGAGLMAGLAPLHLTMFSNSCATSRAMVFTVELGVRWIGQRAELYFGPKFGTVIANISCT
jgi:hypothetical protein